VYVDDILLMRDKMEDINHVKNSLHEAFKIKDLGQAKFFLALDIARTKGGIHIC